MKISICEDTADTLNIAIFAAFALMTVLGMIYITNGENRLCYKQNQEIINQAISNPALAENLLKLVEDCSDVNNKKL